MAKINKYGVSDLNAQFPNDEACVEYIFNTLHSKKCSCGGVYKRVVGRRQYQCSKCRFQIAPTSGTIFHKSDTPLNLWFTAIFLFSNAKSGLSAKQLERDLNVTYKTAWRMLNLIRKSLTQDKKKLKGIVETDQAYFGGKGDAGRNNINLSQVIKDKSAIMGAVERGGRIKVKVVPNATAKTQGDFIVNNVQKDGTRLMTDKTNRLDKVTWGFDRFAVDHHIQEWVRGDVHINNIESFWSHIKRSMKGTHKVVSKKHLQSYLNGFVFHRNNRHNDRERFSSLLGVLLHA